MQVSQQSFRSEAIKPLIGATVRADKEVLLSGEYAQDIRALLAESGVIVFAGAQFSDEEQVRFTKTLGKWMPEGDREVYPISMDKTVNPNADYIKGAFYWHIDGTMDRVPLFASLLSCRRKAPAGGNTDFCNTYSAWEALPGAEQETLKDLRVIHSFAASQMYWNPEPSDADMAVWEQKGEAELPLVWLHDSGRRSLVLGCTADRIVGMDPAASRVLLNRLRNWATQEQFSMSHDWTVGDAVLWDNTGTMHRAQPYPLDCDRLMHRTKLEGEEAFS